MNETMQDPDPSRKPPLGLMPAHIWRARRISEIMRAFVRYEDAGATTPYEWADELREHLNYGRHP
jgi:hypothetical protein